MEGPLGPAALAAPPSAPLTVVGRGRGLRLSPHHSPRSTQLPPHFLFPCTQPLPGACVEYKVHDKQYPAPPGLGVAQQSASLESGMGSEATGAALFPGVTMTTVSWGQKALSLCRGPVMRRRECSRGLARAGQGLREAASLGFSEPSTCLQTDRQGGPAPGSDARGLRTGQGCGNTAASATQAAPSFWTLVCQDQAGSWRREEESCGSGPDVSWPLLFFSAPTPGLSSFREEVSGQLYLCFLWRLSEAQPWP